MRISDWSSDVCSSDLYVQRQIKTRTALAGIAGHRDDILIIKQGLLKFVSPPANLVKGHILWKPQIRNQLGAVRRRKELLRHKRSEEHTSELQSLMRISYAVFCLKKKTLSY